MSVSRQVARANLRAAVKAIERPGLHTKPGPPRAARVLASRHVLGRLVLTKDDGGRTEATFHATKGRRTRYIGHEVAA